MNRYLITIHFKDFHKGKFTKTLSIVEETKTLREAKLSQNLIDETVYSAFITDMISNLRIHTFTIPKQTNEQIPLKIHPQLKQIK